MDCVDLFERIRTNGSLIVDIGVNTAENEPSSGTRKSLTGMSVKNFSVIYPNARAERNEKKGEQGRKRKKTRAATCRLGEEDAAEFRAGAALAELFA
jgi:hypothetical protein